MKSLKVEGLVAAPLTPFDDKGNLKLSVIEEYAEHLKKQGNASVFLCGTAGEGLSLTVDERKQLTERWVDACRERIETVIMHVGTMNIKDTKELARHAEFVGVSAIATQPPTYFKPNSLDALVDYVAEVAAEAPNTPMFYYHFPDMSGVEFCMEDFLTAASGRIPSLVGIKFSCSNLFDFGRCITHSGGKYQMLYGGDETCLAAMVMGCKASVGRTYNYAGLLSSRLMQAYNKGDLTTARKEQYQSQALGKVLYKYGNTNDVHKTIVRFQGLDLGRVRPPITPLTDIEVGSLKKDLEDIGFFKWC